MHWQRLVQKRGVTTPSVVIFASMDAWEGSSRLRAFAMAPALRALGWRVVLVTKHLEVSQRLRILRRERPDVLLFQKGRLPTHYPHFYVDALRAGTRVVFDLDDADYVHPVGSVQCAALAQAASLVTAGSHNVAAWCRQHCPNTHVLWTGTPDEGLAQPARPSQRGPVVTWAQMNPMKYKHEAAIVLSALDRIAQRTVFTLRLYGVEDAQEAQDFFARLRERGVQVQTMPFMPYDAFIESLRDCAAGLHVLASTSKFAEGKSFGKVLAYLSAGVPTIASNLHENPHFFRHKENGLLCNTADELGDACLLLLTSPALRDELSLQAWKDFQASLTIKATGARLDCLMRAMLREPPRPLPAFATS